MMVCRVTEGSVAAKYLILVTSYWCSILPSGFLCISLLVHAEVHAKIFLLVIPVDYSLLISHMNYLVFNSKKLRKKEKTPNILTLVGYMNKIQDFRYRTLVMSL